jgi:hypothetical protein
MMKAVSSMSAADKKANKWLVHKTNMSQVKGMMMAILLLEIT